MKFLYTADLSVGDTLIQAEWNGNTRRWNGGPVWQETKWTVTKILKTRLVLTRTTEALGGILPRVLTLRMLVDAGTGRVSSRQEGESGWGRTSTWLFTPDEPYLASLREEYKGIAEEGKAVDAARKAAEDFTRAEDVETAKAAIRALLDYVALKKGQGK
jgi:hypothetical protein